MVWQSKEETNRQGEERMNIYEALRLGNNILIEDMIPGIHTKRDVRKWIESFAFNNTYKFLQLVKMSFSEQYKEYCNAMNNANEWDL